MTSTSTKAIRTVTADAIHHPADEKAATRPRFGRTHRLRLLAAVIAGTAGLSGIGLVASAGTAGALPNICVVAQQNAEYYMAEYETVLPDTGYQPDLTEVHLGLNYLHLAQMWQSYGRGFGC
jgi:hypothetical protein